MRARVVCACACVCLRACSCACVCLLVVAGKVCLHYNIWLMCFGHGMDVVYSTCTERRTRFFVGWDRHAVGRTNTHTHHAPSTGTPLIPHADNAHSVALGIAIVTLCPMPEFRR